MFNSLAVDGSDGVCLPRRLGAVQCPVHLGDGRPAKGGVNNDDDDDDDDDDEDDDGGGG